ncbi:MAG TPA: YggS family pyridoxal phosphate-dependent enzyme [Candidatus Eisenbacteria bacterium]|nr:YggS family pyridoxal phosphate-dependent enzyme [Candidatus Eisenbacteria bacterium]
MDEARGLADRLDSLRERIGRACARSGRAPESVRLLPITKGFPAETVRGAMALGLREFGENRVQEAEQKIAAIHPRPRWHLVGHLQRNKAKRAVELFDVIHSIDSAQLADEVSRRAMKRVPCLVEVNTSGDRTKFGVSPEGAGELLLAVSGCSQIELHGLMTIGPVAGGPEGARRAFRRLAAIRQEAARTGLLAEDADLSMGMSDDFEIAIEEGATIVRVGTALFGARPAGPGPGRPAGPGPA